jgi:MtrB/PioB family decaheme-associated outer membrane protein
MGAFDVQVNFRNEEKDGSRLFARGTTGGTGGFEFTPEPINSTTRIIESTLGYTADRFQLSGGYVGSFYDNHNSALNFTNSPAAGAGSGFGTFNPMALPPDNHSHQLFFNGGYNLSQTSRATFKFAQSKIKQDNSFVVNPAASVPRTNLGGEVDVTQAQASFTAKPLPKLSVTANVRYEDRDDKTPVYTYFTPASPATTDGKNEPRDVRTLAGKAEATYVLPLGFRVVGGLEHNEVTRNTSAYRAVTFRSKTEEDSYKLELRRALAEDLNGSIAYIHSDRDGSDWKRNTFFSTNATANSVVHPLHLADRTREKVRAKMDWAPADPLSIQFVFEHSNDNYGNNQGRNYGMQDGSATLYSLDATWTISDNWKTSAWAMNTDTRATQRTCENVGGVTVNVCPNTAADPIWEADLRNSSNAYGLNIQGKLTSRIDVGADYQYSHDKNKTKQSTLTAGSSLTANQNVPSTYYKLGTTRLYGTYALEKSSTLRFDLIHARQKTDDWTWQNFTYSDGTRIVRKADESTVFFGASYIYKF